MMAFSPAALAGLFKRPSDACADRLRVRQKRLGAAMTSQPMRYFLVSYRSNERFGRMFVGTTNAVDDCLVERWEAAAERRTGAPALVVSISPIDGPIEGAVQLHDEEARA